MAHADKLEPTSADNTALDLKIELHKSYIIGLQSKKSSFEYAATEHLRMSAIYWGLTAMDLMSAKDMMACEEIIAWVMKCQHPSGGFGGNIDHDAHLLYTLSAVQILALLDKMDLLDRDKVAGYVVALQQPDGSFFGDEWGEIDSRFSYCALNCLALLGRLDRANVAAAVAFVQACRNFDGGFGCIPGAESHGGQIFCCVGALAIAGALDQVDADLLGWWLCERQVPGGGLNGRPEKLPDVCYSWWILTALTVLGRLDWIDGARLREFILHAQDDVEGGIADRPGDEADVFHTFFGLCGLSLLAHHGAEGLPPGAPVAPEASLLQRIDPVYALPVPTLRRLGLPVWGET